MQDKVEKLMLLYAKSSKHSNYQVIPESLQKLMPTKNLIIHSRYEKERLAYILSKINIKGLTFADIGGNSGYFTIKLIEQGAQKGTIIEGNATHTEFVSLASELLKIESKIEICNKYYDFGETMKQKYDIIFLLNVLHHVGDDFGNAISIEEAKDTILDKINGMVKVSKHLVLQLGYNWMGNRNQCLFPNGTKTEMIEWLREGVRGYYQISHIGIAEKVGEKIIYRDINEHNIERQDSLGEFLNRPIFILDACGDR